ncbi:hypothetical protein [Weissella minor]|uniref:hypothetical protein n=1 Tax=Weissella minor TaxID=1620 RepID=UPI00070E150F|nr:hypothetical protein [Weissella minor]
MTKFDDFWNYINSMLENANDELNYCIRGLDGDEECNEDNPGTTHEDWVASIHYAEQDINELEAAKKMLERFEKSLEEE